MIEIYINIIKNQKGYIKDTIPYLLMVIACCILIRAIYCIISNHFDNMISKSKSIAKHKKTTILHELGIVAFVIYVVALFFITISLTLQYENHLELKENINIIPVNSLVEFIQKSIKKGNLGIAELKICGNMILFMPMGFFIPLLWNLKEDLNAVLFGFIVSVIIEICQLCLNLGADVDNLILNTLGALLGYLLYTICYKAFPELSKKFKVIKMC